MPKKSELKEKGRVMRKIVLASASERRSRILNECGIPHEVIVSGYPEHAAERESVWDVVAHNALKKAEVVAAESENSLVIGADTLVSHNGQAIGKPSDAGSAKALLRGFSGSRIEVYSGICLIDNVTRAKACGIDCSEIFVREITEDEIEKYFKLLGPYDKAGGFSVEGVGALIFDDIRGSYYNILGLPMTLLYRLFKEIGLDISDHIKK